jgi:hypothetical protein
MATLSSYITEVRRLLHDANANFWTDAELTDAVNGGRQRIVRDTGCLRTIQVSSTPLGGDGNAATVWTAGAVATLNSYVYNSIFIYQVTQSGVLGTTAPPYPSATNVYPPSGAFNDGTAQLTYFGPAEIIPYSALPEGSQTLDVLNLNLYWGNSRIPLRYLPWSNFNAQLRYWQNYVGRPVCFSIFGQSQIYIAPVPDQSYTIELDTVILPTDLTLSSPNTTDQINDPYTSPVKFYAAYLAKYKEQSYGEAEIYKQEYMKQAQSVLNSVFTRRIPDAYSSPY